MNIAAISITRRIEFSSGLKIEETVRAESGSEDEDEAAGQIILEQLDPAFELHSSLKNLQDVANLAITLFSTLPTHHISTT